jgi:pimeloyl-ACP methyl ester carboxylesterase
MDAPSLVLLHGFTGHSRSWDPFAADLECFVAALGLQRFSLLGMSMGGIVTMEYAGRRPRPLAGCAIIDIGPGLTDWVEPYSGERGSADTLQAAMKPLRSRAPTTAGRPRLYIDGAPKRA